ncbi:MAG TPA: hypothetical protein VMU81_27880 [Acetobacteraceae bacterium]|nr:hypothetical protein [Acetobacteraceae bacterium]
MPETIEMPPTAPGRLFEGFLTPHQLETETGWGWRTVLRREAEGLPVVKIGATKLYPIAQVRAWLLAQAEKRQTEPRGRGRPRKAA